MKIDDIYLQLTRYGGVFNDDLENMLEIISDINDDLWHGRSQEFIRQNLIKLYKYISNLFRLECCINCKLHENRTYNIHELNPIGDDNYIRFYTFCTLNNNAVSDTYWCEKYEKGEI